MHGTLSLSLPFTCRLSAYLSLSHPNLSVPSHLTPALFCHELIQSFLITYHFSISSSCFLFLSVSCLHPKLLEFRIVQKHFMPAEATTSDLKFLSACSQPEGTGARWSAQQHEVEKGGCIFLPALISSHLPRHANVSSALLVTSTRCEGRFSANPGMKRDTERTGCSRGT